LIAVCCFFSLHSFLSGHRYSNNIFRFPVRLIGPIRGRFTGPVNPMEDV
jgi:hypothetical protein